jgi:hypothetical protein
MPAEEVSMRSDANRVNERRDNSDNLLPRQKDLTAESDGAGQGQVETTSRTGVISVRHLLGKKK